MRRSTIMGGSSPDGWRGRDSRHARRCKARLDSRAGPGGWTGRLDRVAVGMRWLVPHAPAERISMTPGPSRATWIAVAAQIVPGAILLGGGEWALFRTLPALSPATGTAVVALNLALLGVLLIAFGLARWRR